MKNPKILFSLFLIIFLILLSLAGWWKVQLFPFSSDETTKSFIIPNGQGSGEIADRLEAEKLIRSALALKIYLRKNSLSDKIQAGTFKLSPSMSIPEIIDNLNTGATDVWVTLLEGWRVEEMGEELSKKFKVESEEFLEVAKEGYMFPDTYLFPKDFTEQQISNTLKDTFEAKFTDDLKSQVKAQGLTEKEAIILASIVEREARSQQARTQVASILLRRLKIGMGLNADATIQYILGYQKDEKSWWKRHLTKTDLKINSPYNTYIHSGLPPTPICNPSLSSIKAVANADPSTPYLYYYHDSKGISHYGKTLEEHNENVANNP